MPEKVEVPPDAGMSLLGVYGLRSPTMVWLLNKRPDLLAETPTEWEARNASQQAPPRCDQWTLRRIYDPKTGEAETDERGQPIYYPHEQRCSSAMVFRYVHNRPAWVCMSHDGADATYRYHYRLIERPTPKLQTVPSFNLARAIKATLDGAMLDLRWDADEGGWKVIRA